MIEAPTLMGLSNKQGQTLNPAIRQLTVWPDFLFLKQSSGCGHENDKEYRYHKLQISIINVNELDMHKTWNPTNH